MGISIIISYTEAELVAMPEERIDTLFQIATTIYKSLSRRRQKAENEEQYLALRHEEPLVPIDNTYYIKE